MSLAQTKITSAEIGKEVVYDDGHLRVEHDNYYAACDGVPVELGRTEFLIVSRLARNFDRIVPAEELWNFAWSDAKPFNAVSLRVYIYRLRGKLEPCGLRIETMINVGYRISRAAPVNSS